MTRYGAWVLGALLVSGTSGLRAETLTSDQQASLDRLRQDLWDQGYSDSEIQAEIDRKRAGFTGAKPSPAAPAPPAPDAQGQAPAPPPSEDALLSRLLGQIRELVGARVLTPEKAEEAQAKARAAWQEAGPPGRAALLKNVRGMLTRAVVEAWRKELVKAGTDKGLPNFRAQPDATDALIRKRRKLDDARADLRKQGDQGEALVEKLKARFPEVPSVYFEAEDEEQPPPPPKETAAAPAFSDDEIDEIVDTMLEELDRP